MLFSSTVFLFLFLPMVLIFYYLPFTKNRKYRNTVLLLASLFFYAWGEPVFVFVMLLSMLFNWIAGKKIESAAGKRRKWTMIGITAFDIGLLFIFKYLTFFMQNVNRLFFGDSLLIRGIALPIGISFFTFQILSYIFDVYYGKTAAQKRLLDLALYISMFPQLIAGPIVRYDTIADELNNRKETKEDFTQGIGRFIFGLGKKVILSNQLATIADKAFALSGEGALSVGMAWLGILAYTLQIYFDFSGYSDMAIGLGRLFGFHFSENFNYPYISGSITEFWRRWHISLSRWFRDYVYIPLGGNRTGKGKHIRNMFLVWLLTGIWHGANWTFVLWGMVYFVLLFLEKYTGFVQKIGKIPAHIYTLLMVMVCWVIFRADSIGAAGQYLGNMFGIGAAGGMDEVFLFYMGNFKVWLLVSVIGCMPWTKKLQERFGENTLCQLGKELLQIAILLVSISYLLRGTYNPFVYFNF